MATAFFSLILLSKIAVISSAKIGFAFLLNYSAVALSALSLGSRLPKRIVIVCIFSLLFLIGGQYKAAFSCLLLIGIAKVYASFISVKSKNRSKILLFLMIFSIITLDLQTFLTGNFASTYGRNQVLFGIFHPKEQAIFIVFSYLTFFVIPRKGKLSFLGFSIVAALLYITDARVHLYSFLVFGFVYLVGYRTVFLLFLIPIFISPLLIYIIFENWELLNSFSSERLRLWRDIIVIGYSVGANSIDSSWLEFGRNNVVNFFIAVPFLFAFFLITAINILRTPDNKFFGAMFIYFLLSNTTDLGAFSSTNMISMIFWATYLYPSSFNFKRRSIAEK